MRVLVVHNRYRQPGGEDEVVRSETKLLRDQGNDVSQFEADNGNIEGLVALVKTAALTVYSPRARDDVRDRIKTFRPDIVHVHNWFPRLSPSIYDACRDANVPVVQTLHNYRLLCLNAVMHRDGKPCDVCVNRGIAWPGILHGCYRGSRAGSAVVATMLATHRVLGTWTNKVSAFIALNEGAKNRFVSAGIPSEKITVKPNFVDVCLPSRRGNGGYALFVGRLSKEKGISTLLSAWRLLEPTYKLRIIGDGPLASMVVNAVSTSQNVEWLGSRAHDEVIKFMTDASFLIFPSECEEQFGLAVIEAFAVGTPVIASRRGAPAEILQDGRTGRLFTPGDARELAEITRWAFANTDKMREMGSFARMEYENKYTPSMNYSILKRIYKDAIASRLHAGIGRD